MNVRFLPLLCLPVAWMSCVPQPPRPEVVPSPESSPVAVRQIVWPERPESAEQRQELSETARKRGAEPPIPFSFDHGVTVAGDVEVLRARVAAAAPGDIILVPEGGYLDMGVLHLAANGTADAPITLRAATPGRAVFSGESALRITGDYWIVEGLYFDQAVFSGEQYVSILEVEGAQGVRITQCAFHASGAPDVKYVPAVKWAGGAREGRIDHCTFVDSLSMTLQIRVGPEEADTARNIRVDHNHFHDILRRHKNGGECIQIGSNPMKYGHLEAHAVVENNRFERADGDGEVISVKSSGNVIRNNSFLGCGGALWLRGGGSSVVEGNLFLRGSSGMVVYGHGHRIRGNLMRNTHSYGMLISYGSDWQQVAHAGLSFEALKDSIVQGNVIEDPVVRGLVYGAFRLDSPGREHLVNPPQDNQILDNVLVGKSDRLLMATGYGNTPFQGNGVFQPRPTNKEPLPKGFELLSKEAAMERIPEVNEMTPENVGAEWL